ncbi:MAG TPA: thioesterase family protein [Solirubrobacterales bacterium]|nr:thioesterase family protein [Solirubrobacterales bacterium]
MPIVGNSETSDVDPANSAFYIGGGDRFDATPLTRGPWDGGTQHAGPPAALLGRAVERLDGVGDGPASRAVGRITFEILGPIPIAPVAIAAEVVRPGRRVDLVEGTLSGADGEPLIRARAWRLLRRDLALPGGLDPRRRPVPPAPAELAPADAFFPTGHAVGYHTAMEYRFAAGSFVERGPGTVWMRMRHPLVAGEEPTPLQRVLIVADSGNGISATLDFERWIFINVDLTVHLSRMPAGEWVCLDSVTVPEPDGIGLTDTVLHDEHGPIGLAAQTLLVDER